MQYGIGTLLVYIYMYKCTFKTVIASDNPVAGAIYNLLTYLFFFVSVYGIPCISYAII